MIDRARVEAGSVCSEAGLSCQLTLFSFALSLAWFVPRLDSVWDFEREQANEFVLGACALE